MTLIYLVCMLTLEGVTACGVTEFHACACLLKVPHALRVDSG